MSQAAYEAGTIPPETMGWRLQRSLSFAGVSVQEMADELGVSRGTISRWCNDKNRPRRSDLRLWALRCGVPLDWLQHGLEPQESAERSNIRHIMEDQPPSQDEILGHSKRIDALRDQLHGPSRRGPIRRAEIGNTSVIPSAVQAIGG